MKRLLLGLTAAALLGFIVGVMQTSTRAATEIGGVWTEFHAPAAATQATITHAAVNGRRHIVNCIMAHLVGGASHAAAFESQVVIRDGSSGVGTIIWSAPLAIPATAGSSGNDHEICGLAIGGTIGNAITIEFVSTSPADTFESVYMQGHSEQ